MNLPRLLSVAAVCCAAPALPLWAQAAEAAPEAVTLGSSKQNAIEVCMPAGQRAYLARLRCDDGQAPTFQRSGSVGMRTALPEQIEGESSEAYLHRVHEQRAGYGKDYHIVDVYRVACSQAVHSVYLDMYHCQAAAPSQAPAGFSIVPE